MGFFAQIHTLEIQLQLKNEADGKDRLCNVISLLCGTDETVLQSPLDTTGLQEPVNLMRILHEIPDLHTHEQIQPLTYVSRFLLF